MKAFTSPIHKIIAGLLVAAWLSGSVNVTFAQQPTQPLVETAETSSLYIPIILTPPPPDLTISNIEPTQAIQNLSNSVPMVAKRPAVIRVYARTSKKITPKVRVSLTGTRDGVALPGSPLSSDPGSVWTNATDISTLRASASKSFNFQLPSSWLSGDVTLKATVDSTHLITEANESNNTKTITLKFKTVPDLNVVVVPINYADAFTGLLFPAPSSDFIDQALFSMYPVDNVNVTVHNPISFYGDLGNPYYYGDWDRLLENKIHMLKESEGKPAATVYYGLIPLDDGSGNTWFYGGVAGLGFVSYRAAVGLTDAPQFGIPGDEIVAHEIGHNLGRAHAPCDVSPSDSNFPYAGGKIGQYGLRVHLLPTLSIVPPTTPDVMGYCDGPLWVSDYTYKGLYTNQAGSASYISLAPQESLYVRASLTSDNQASLLPAYVLTISPSAPATDNEYAIELLDESGAIVLSYPVELSVTEEPGLPQIRSIHARLPLPTQPFTSVRLVKNSQTLAEQSMNPSTAGLSAAPSVTQDAQTLSLHWNQPDTPALVRYTTDGGQTWTTVDSDVLGGTLNLEMAHLPNTFIQFEIILAGGASRWTIDWQPTIR